MNLKKSDIILMSIMLFFSAITLGILAFINSNQGNLTAIIYDMDGNVYERPLYGIENYEETFNGTLGDVVVEYENGRVRVIKETSPQHICSKQGWSSSVFKPIVCLPNDFYIEIVGDKNDEFDGGVG